MKCVFILNVKCKKKNDVLSLSLSLPLLILFNEQDLQHVKKILWTMFNNLDWYSWENYQ